MSEISIRIAGPEDAPALLELYAYYVRHTAITFEYEVPSLEEFTARIRHTLEKCPYLAAVENGAIVGYAYAGPFHPRAAYGWAAEATIYLSHGCRHQGLGKRLYRALEEILRIGRSEPERLHCRAGSRRRIPDPEQPGVPHPPGLPAGGGIYPVRL